MRRSSSTSSARCRWREPADRLARGDPALCEDLVDLHAPVLRHGQHQVEDLRGLEVFGGSSSSSWIALAARLEVALELGALLRMSFARCERLHALVQRTLGRGGVFGRRITAPAAWRRLYILEAGSVKRQPAEFRLDLNLSLSIVEQGSGGSAFAKDLMPFCRRVVATRERLRPFAARARQATSRRSRRRGSRCRAAAPAARPRAARLRRAAAIARAAAIPPDIVVMHGIPRATAAARIS